MLMASRIPVVRTHTREAGEAGRMIEHTAARGAEAAWKRHLEEVAKRNDATHKQARADQQSRDGAAAARRRDAAEREAEQLAAMNKRIDKRRRTSR